MTFQTLDRMMKCCRRFSHEKARLADYTSTECMLLAFISAHPDGTQDDAAAAFMMDKTTVAKAMATLEDKGTLTRERMESNHRKKRITLTPKGEELVVDIKEMHERWVENVLSALEPEECEAFTASFAKVMAAAEALVELPAEGENR